MKRPLLIILAGIIGVSLILLFRPKTSVVNEQAKALQSTETNVIFVPEEKISPTVNITQTLPTVITPTESKELFNIVKAQDLADWTNAIPNIRPWSHFRSRSSWIADQGTNKPPTLLLTLNGNTIEYKAKLTDVEILDNKVHRIELQTPFMDIKETREFGESLLQMMGKDNGSFDAWCDKVGNNWVDAPEWTSGGAQMPDSNKFYGFATHITFNNERPWYIDFFITNP